MKRGRQLAKFFIQWVLPIAVLAAVGKQFYDIVARPEFREEFVKLHFRWPWLLGSALLYLCAHCVWSNFWVRLLNQQDFPTTQLVGLRSYFVSQLGKYIPGKIWVIAIRVWMLGNSMKTRAVVGVTATFEALTSMAAGAFLAALLMPLLKSDLAMFSGKTYYFLAIGGVPAGLVLLNRMIVRLAHKRSADFAGHIPRMRFATLVVGLVQNMGGWLLMGLSLWMTIQGILPQPMGFDFEQLLRLSAINAIAYVAGFLFLFMPGGVGVREEVMRQLLTPEFQASQGDGASAVALVVALVLRLSWTAAELLCAFTLYRGVGRLPKNSRNPSLVPEVAA